MAVILAAAPAGRAGTHRAGVQRVRLHVCGTFCTATGTGSCSCRALHCTRVWARVCARTKALACGGRLIEPVLEYCVGEVARGKARWHPRVKRSSWNSFKFVRAAGARHGARVATRSGVASGVTCVWPDLNEKGATLIMYLVPHFILNWVVLCEFLAGLEIRTRIPPILQLARGRLTGN